MNERGLSLVEIVLVTAAVITLGILIVNLVSPLSSINKSRHSSIAKEIASKQIENLRKQGYASIKNLDPEEINFSDSRLASLPSSSAFYIVEDCPLDVCTEEEYAKKVKVGVLWNESGEIKRVELVTIISEGGIGQ